MAHCSATNSRGEPCRAAALRGSSFCYMHHPSLRSARSASRRLGGFHSRGAHAPSEFSGADLKTPAGLVRFVDELIRATCELDPSVNRARVLGYLARVQHKTIEFSQLDQRIQALELILRKREVPDPKD